MYIISQQKTFEHNHKMKTIKLFAGICAIAAICACGNAKQEAQAQATENTIEEVKEQGTVFYDITLEEALAKAKAEGKHVLINFHTSTCVPCKKMEMEVFPTPECGKYVNEHFVPIAIDGEDEGAGTELAEKYQIFIFPTYLIMSPDGFKEGEVIGAEFDVNKFLEMLKEINHEV